jgi:hypothetical protein
MTKSLEDKIRERAYALWEQDGRVHGRADEHWLKASLEVIGAMAGGELMQSSPVEASPSIHEETQTSVDEGGMVTPKASRAARKSAGTEPAAKRTATKKLAPKELVPIPTTPVGRKRKPTPSAQ